jgi:hypothetical protein
MYLMTSSSCSAREPSLVTRYSLFTPAASNDGGGSAAAAATAADPAPAAAPAVGVRPSAAPWGAPAVASLLTHSLS